VKEGGRGRGEDVLIGEVMKGVRNKGTEGGLEGEVMRRDPKVQSQRSGRKEVE